MNEEVYSAPKSDLQKEVNIEVPQEILKKIKSAWIAGTVSIVITIIFTLISMSGNDILGLNAFAFVDVFLMAIFAFGIYKKSRVCAILMLLLFAANKVLMWSEAGTTSGLPLALVFLWFYTMGVVGTFQFHSFKKRQQA